MTDMKKRKGNDLLSKASRAPLLEAIGIWEIRGIEADGLIRGFAVNSRTGSAMALPPAPSREAFVAGARQRVAA